MSKYVFRFLIVVLAPLSLLADWKDDYLERLRNEGYSQDESMRILALEEEQREDEHQKAIYGISMKDVFPEKLNPVHLS